MSAMEEGKVLCFLFFLSYRLIQHVNNRVSCGHCPFSVIHLFPFPVLFFPFYELQAVPLFFRVSGLVILFFLLVAVTVKVTREEKLTK